MAVNRRMGPRDSATYHALLDATEKVLENDGYGAATSRRIATVAGVRQQLVYYYFETMDELLLSTFKRRTEAALAKLELELKSNEPIRALWDFLCVTANGKLGFEFVALANHHDGVRDAIAKYVVSARRLGAAAIARQYEDRGISMPVQPVALAFIMDCISLLLRREEGSGIHEGHAEAREFIKWVLKQVS